MSRASSLSIVLIASAVSSVGLAIFAAQTVPPSMEVTPQVGHGALVEHVAFSPDRRLAISTSEDTTAKLWHLEAGQLLRTLRGHTNTVTSAVFLPDGRRAVTTGFDGDAILWNLESGAIERRFHHEHIVWWADVSRDSRTLVTTSMDGTIGVWAIDTGDRRITIDDLVDPPRWIRLSPDGRRALATRGARFLLIDLEQRVVRNIREGGAAPHVRDAAFSDDGTRFLAGDDDNGLRLYDAESLQVLRTFTGHTSAVSWVGFLPDGRPASVGFEGERIEWRLDGRPASTRKTPGASQLWAFSGDGSRGVTKAGEGFSVWNLTDSSPPRVYDGYRQQIGALAVVGSTIAALTDESELHLWNIETGAHERMIETDEPLGISVGVAVMDVSATRRAATGHSRAVKVWDLARGALVRAITHEGNTAAVAISSDGMVVAAGGYELPVTVWNVDGSGSPRIMADAPEQLSALAISPDRRWLIAGGVLDACLWNLHDGSLVWRKRITSSSNVGALAFTRDSARIAMATEQHTFVADVATGAVTHDLAGHGWIGGVAWDSQGKKLLTSGGATLGDEEDLVRLWDVDTKQVLWEGRGHLGTIHAAAFSADGRHVVTGAADGIVRIWQPGTPNWMALVARGDEWLIYGDDGAFDASPRGGELAAAVRGLEGYRIDQLASRFNRPDVLLRRLGLGSADLLTTFDARYRRRLAQLGVVGSTNGPHFDAAPEVRITSLAVAGRTVTVEAAVDSRGRALSRLQVFVNGVPIFGGGGKALPADTKEIVERVELGAGVNRVEVSVRDAAGIESLRDFRSVTIAQPRRGSLYYIGFGVSDYNADELDLRYADKDICDLGAYFGAAASHYRAAHVHTFVNRDATVEAIRAAKRLLERTTVDDVVVVFVAGHGAYLPDAAADYMFLTVETEPARLRDTAAPLALIEELFDGVKARHRLLLIDACESGERDDDRDAGARPTAASRELIARNVEAVGSTLARKGRAFLLDRNRFIFNDLSRRTGAVVFAASLGREYSYETDHLRHGYFTASLLDALTSKRADTNKDGFVTTDELHRSVRAEVAMRTDGLQHPTIDRDNPDVTLRFPIAPLPGTLPQCTARRASVAGPSSVRRP